MAGARRAAPVRGYFLSNFRRQQTERARPKQVAHLAAACVLDGQSSNSTKSQGCAPFLGWRLRRSILASSSGPASAGILLGRERSTGRERCRPPQPHHYLDVVGRVTHSVLILARRSTWCFLEARLSATAASRPSQRTIRAQHLLKSKGLVWNDRNRWDRAPKRTLARVVHARAVATSGRAAARLPDSKRMGNRAGP